MDDKILVDIARQLGVIGRALAYLSLNSQTMDGSSQGRQVKFLKTLGFKNPEIADLLDTSVNAVAVRLAEEKKRQSNKKVAIKQRQHFDESE